MNVLNMLDKPADIVDTGFGFDAVAEIEDEAASVLHGGEELVDDGLEG